MFRSNLRDFEEDPFFRDHQDRMSSLVGGYGDPFASFGFPSTHPALGNGRQAGRSPHMHSRQVAPNHMFGGMFGDMFTSMNFMMANMHQNFERMTNDPNTFSYSSSSVMSYSNDGRGEPTYFQATKSTKKAPGGVRETQHSVRDSQSGLHRMAIGHHLDDRSHVIERSLNRRTGQEERKQDFINLDESDAATFDQEWKQRTRHSTNILTDRHRTHLRALGGTDRSTHPGRHPGASDTGASLHRDRLRGHQDGPGAHLPVENRHLDHRVARDKDWGKGDFDVAERRHRHKPNPDKHVRLNSRPVNKHEPR